MSGMETELRSFLWRDCGAEKHLTDATDVIKCDLRVGVGLKWCDGRLGTVGEVRKRPRLTVSAGGQAEMPIPRVEVIKLGEGT